jgi:glycosyltransferase involved in cell wall biosynthesis
MKIAMIIPWFSPLKGGAENGALELSKCLVRRGHEVHVITPRYRRSWPREEKIDGIIVHRFFTLGIPGLKKISEALHSIWPFFGIPSLLNKIKPDIIHLHYILFTGHAGVSYSKKSKTPTVLTVVGNDVYDPFDIPADFLHSWNKKVANGVHHIAASNSFVARVMREKFSVPEDNVSVVPYGIDVNRFTPLKNGFSFRDNLGIPKDATVVLTVQRLHERKEVHFFLEAAKYILEKKKDAYFLVVGRGPEEKRLKQLAKETQIDKSVIFTGFVPDDKLVDVYRSADVFTFHTTYEGFGIVVLEAMATATPVVTTRAVGTEEIVTDGETGILVLPRLPLELAKATLRVIENKELRTSLAANGRRSAIEKFSWEKIADRYLALYKKVSK